MAHVTCSHVPFYIQIGGRGKRLYISGKASNKAKHNLLALPTKGKDIVFRFIIIEYISLMDCIICKSIQEMCLSHFIHSYLWLMQILWIK
jgi:hypothetical protein